MRESVIEDYLIRRVREAGGATRKVQWIGRRGAPDRAVFFPGGRLIWVEVKATGELPTHYQRAEHARLRRLGQWVEVIDSFAAVEALCSR